MRRLDCHDRLKRLRGNYGTALRALETLQGIVKSRPEILRENGLDLAEMEIVAKQLHDIYFVRVFASFESSIRNYWRTAIKDTKPPTKQLISSIARKFGVSENTLDSVQEIREFRNTLVHDDSEVGKPYTIEAASSPLNTYLARLPLHW